MLRLSCQLSPEFTGGWINGPVQITGEQSIQDLVSFFELHLLGGLMVCKLGSQARWGALPMIAYKGRLLVIGGIFFSHQVNERVGILLAEVYKRVGKSVIWVCKRAQKI